MDSLIGLLGVAGVGFLLLAYFLLIIGHIKASDTHYLVLNVLGALLIVMCQYLRSPVPLPYALALWLCISLFGFYKHHLAVTE